MKIGTSTTWGVSFGPAKRVYIGSTPGSATTAATSSVPQSVLSSGFDPGESEAKYILRALVAKAMIQRSISRNIRILISNGWPACEVRKHEDIDKKGADASLREKVRLALSRASSGGERPSGIDKVVVNGLDTGLSPDEFSRRVQEWIDQNPIEFEPSTSYFISGTTATASVHVTYSSFTH